MRAIYLDSCVVIYYLERHPTLGPRVEAALFPADGARTIPVVSDLTRLECRVLPLRRQDQDLLARYDAFFGLPDCRQAPIDTGVFDLATELRARQGLKTPDALHLAAAIRSGCEEIWTNDTRLATAAAERLRVVVFEETE
jgi:uncharacterized protein